MDLRSLKVDQLKRIALSLGVAKSGRKEDLVKRIEDNLPETTLEVERPVEYVCYCSPNVYKSGPQTGPKRSQTRECSCCHHLVHVECCGTPDPICLQCVMYHMDPFQPVVHHLWVGIIGDKPTCFVLDFPDMHKWRKMGYEVSLRCLGLSKPCSTHEWPWRIQVYINDYDYVVDPPKPDVTRRDAPVNVTCVTKAEHNVFRLMAAGPDNSRGRWLLGVVLTSTSSVEYIANQVREFQYVKAPEARDRVQKLLALSSNEDVEVLTAEGTLSLRCPISFCRILTPARGFNCTHLQCFDLTSFLEVTRRSASFKNRWRCPKCQNILFPKNLMVDGFLDDILKQVVGDGEVLVNPDGTWTFFRSEDEPPEDAAELLDPPRDPALGIILVESSSESGSDVQAV